MTSPTPRPTLAALAVVCHAGAVLLVQRRNPPDAGLWGFPGGHVELGETALAAAVRELAEETGVQARAEGYLTNLDVIRHGADRQISHHFLLAVVQCTWLEGEPAAGDDALDADWVTLERLTSGALPTSRDVLRVARMALSD